MLRRCVAPLVGVFLACTNDKSDRTPPVPLASPPSASASSAPHATDAAEAVDAGVVACSFALPKPFDKLKDVPSPLVLRALVPTYDESTKRAKVELDGKKGPLVHDCSGEALPALWDDGTDAPGSRTPPGTVRIIGRKRLPNDLEAVWVATAKDLGACSLPDGYGLFAIAGLSGQRIDVLGVSEWRPECHNARALRAETLGEETVYVEPESFGTGAGRSTWENVWTLRHGVLHLAGKYDTSADGGEASGAGQDDAGVFQLPGFVAKPRIKGDQIVLAGTTQWQKVVKGDAGDAFVVAESESWTKTFALEGDKLKERTSPLAGTLECRAMTPNGTAHQLSLAWKKNVATGSLRTVFYNGAPTTKAVTAELYKGLILVNPAGKPLASDRIATMQTEGKKSLQVGSFTEPLLPCQ